MSFKFVIIISILLLSFSARAQVVHRMQFDRFSHYEPDDWITYAPASDITDIDIGDDYVYFATRSGGILRYHLYELYWDYPLTTSIGLRSNHILHISFDIQTHQLFAETPKGIDVFNPSFGYWQPAQRAALPERQQPLPEEVKTYRKNPDFHCTQLFNKSFIFLCFVRARGKPYHESKPYK